MSMMMGLICAGVTVLIVVMSIIMAVSSMMTGGGGAKKAEEWSALANSLGFQRSASGVTNSVEGGWKGHRATMRVAQDLQTGQFEQHSDRKVWTHIAVHWPSQAQLGLSITQRGHATNMLGIPRARQRIKIGDAQFDRAVVIKGHDAAAVAAFLKPPMRAEMMRVVAMHDFVEFTDAGAEVTLGGWRTDPQELAGWLDTLAGVVAVAVATHER